MDVIKFIEYSRKCNRSDCTYYKELKFSIERFDAIAGECILENREEITYECFHCKTINIIDLTKFATEER